jgi:hypothetical protein
VGRVQGCIDGFERQWSLTEIETVGEIVGVGIGISERRQAERFLDQVRMLPKS